MYENIVLGADPELFLRRNDGCYVPCIDVIGGTKKDPNYITDEGHAMQEDNVMVEFNIPPSKTKDEFIHNLGFTMNHILDNLEDDLGLHVVPSVEFEWEQLEHEQAKVSGCSPYLNAYTKEEETVILDDTNIRYAGGHIHIGYDEPTIKKTDKLVKALDLYLALPSLLLDLDDRRRQTYGKAGMFRIKDYGFEYRSLSNFWLKSEKLMEWVWDNTMEAVQFVESGLTPPDNLNEIINGCNKQQAKETIREYGIPH